MKLAITVGLFLLTVTVTAESVSVCSLQDGTVNHNLTDGYMMREALVSLYRIQNKRMYNLLFTLVCIRLRYDYELDMRFLTNVTWFNSPAAASLPVFHFFFVKS